MIRPHHKLHLYLEVNYDISTVLFRKESNNNNNTEKNEMHFLTIEGRFQKNKSQKLKKISISHRDESKENFKIHLSFNR